MVLGAAGFVSRWGSRAHRLGAWGPGSIPGTLLLRKPSGEGLRQIGGLITPWVLVGQAELTRVAEVCGQAGRGQSDTAPYLAIGLTRGWGPTLQRFP